MPARFALRGRLVIDGRLIPGAVVVEGGRIVEVMRGEPASGSLPKTVYTGSVVAPGFIDLQVNGGFGSEVGEDPEAIRHLSARLPSTGVTAFLPTIVSSPPDFYARVFQAFADAKGAGGAIALGLHLEGPYLAMERKGAHSAESIVSPPESLSEAWLSEASVRLVTLAPERPGNLERIRRLRSHGILVSLGHTAATYEQFLAGIEAGATLVTHLFSAMTPFHHRTPGAAGAALIDDRVAAGLIVDGIHCHPASIRLALEAKGVERAFLVTDMMSGAGLGPGTYELGGQTVEVDAVSARLPDGTLAGSVLTLDAAVRNAVNLAGASIADACRMASEVPARVLGLPGKGRLAPSCDGDLVLLDEDLRVRTTFTGGRLAYQADDARP